MDSLKKHRIRQLTERLDAGPEWIVLPHGFDLVFRTEFGTAVDPANFRHYTYAATERAGVEYDEDGKPIPGTGHRARPLDAARAPPLRSLAADRHGAPAQDRLGDARPLLDPRHR